MDSTIVLRRPLGPSARKVEKIIAAAQPQMAYLKEVVGYAPQEMSKYPPQSPLSNWFADSMLEMAERLTGERCDVSVNNFGGIRTDMPSGDIVVSDLLSMFPFKNYVTILRMRGSKLMEFFSWLASTQWQVLGGVQIECDGPEILSVRIGGEPLQEDKLYTVETNSFLLNGGDGIYLRDMAEECRILEYDNYDALLQLLREKKERGIQIAASIDDRIVDRGAKPFRGPKIAKKKDRAEISAQGGHDAAVMPSLVILHTNDMHSHVEPVRGGKDDNRGGFVRIAAFVDSIRTVYGRGNVLVVDAGDWDQGSPYFTIFGGALERDCMNAIGYDAAAIGNHEWDNGPFALRDRLRKASFKPLLCNYMYNDFPGFEKVVKPYAIVRRGGLKIGLIGVLSDVTSTVDEFNREKLCYRDPSLCINPLASFLKNDKGCDLVIVLSHCGYDGAPGNPGDTEYVSSLRNVDIIVGGHTHTDLRRARWLSDADGRSVMIVTDHRWGLHVGQINVYDKQKQ